MLNFVLVRVRPISIDKFVSFIFIYLDSFSLKERPRTEKDFIERGGSVQIGRETQVVIGRMDRPQDRGRPRDLPTCRTGTQNVPQETGEEQVLSYRVDGSSSFSGGIVAQSV